MNVLHEIEQEDMQIFAYPDEKIASNIYNVSLSYSYRALDGMDGSEREQKAKLNEWLVCETGKIHSVPVLDFDNITKKLANGKKSCDAFFYNFCPADGEQHYLAEMKNANKKTVLGLLETENEDSIFQKVNDTVQMIRQQLDFGGTQEKEEIILNTHFFIVYAGKNDVPSREPLDMPKRTTVIRDNRGKQKRAGRMAFDSVKRENEIYERFESKIHKLGLAACDEDTFPGDALPRAKKTVKGGKKQRIFSLLSARDFAIIVESGFFDNWNWGSYQTYLSVDF